MILTLTRLCIYRVSYVFVSSYVFYGGAMIIFNNAYPLGDPLHRFRGSKFRQGAPGSGWSEDHPVHGNQVKRRSGVY